MKAEVKYQHTVPMYHGRNQPALQKPLHFAEVVGREKRQSHAQDHAGQAAEVLQLMLSMAWHRHGTARLRRTISC